MRQPCRRRVNRTVLLILQLQVPFLFSCGGSAVVTVFSIFHLSVTRAHPKNGFLFL